MIEIELHMSKRHQLKVIIDTDGGITLTKCTEISRKISRMLDEVDEIKSGFNLEVSSPGVGNPLQVFRQYLKNVGRDVSITMLSGEKQVGKLLQAEEDRIIISPKKGKKKGKQNESEEQVVLDLSDIKETKVLVSFK